MKRLSLCILIALFIGILSTSCTKEYSVTVTAGEGGVAYADKTNATKGETITLTATVTKSGYFFKQWIVLEDNIVLSPDSESNSVTFIMPDNAVSLNAEFYKPGEKFGIDVVKIPSGTFLMGSPDTEPNRLSGEIQHSVTLTKDFYMSKYQITNSQYAAFLNAKEIAGTPLLTNLYLEGTFTGAICRSGSNSGQHLIYDPSTSAEYSYYNWGLNWDSVNSKWIPVSGYENHPVIWVTWYGAVEYTIWVGGSLPTEAQWEYACRGDKKTLPFGVGTGKKLIADMANFRAIYPYDFDHPNTPGHYEDQSQSSLDKGKTTAVGSYLYPNSYGLYDMHGNVWEWCLDWFDSYDAGSATDPTGPSTGYFRILRGGNWNSNAQSSRSAYRYSSRAGIALNIIGFRVVFVP